MSSKSAQEISELLDEYGIKHGPVVDSTRSLYEKKLKEAMTKGKRPAKAATDKTYYREEEEEVTYLTRTPVRSCTSGDSGSYMRSRPEWTEREYEAETSYNYLRSKPEYRGRDFVDESYVYRTSSPYTNSYLKSTPMKPAEDPPKAPKSSRLIPAWVQFLFFLIVVVFLYLVFSDMETNETMKGIE